MPLLQTPAREGDVIRSVSGKMLWTVVSANPSELSLRSSEGVEVAIENNPSRYIVTSKA